MGGEGVSFSDSKGYVTYPIEHLYSLRGKYGRGGVACGASTMGFGENPIISYPIEHVLSFESN